MKKRKRFIIDKDFQLRTTLSIIGIVIIIVSVIITFIGIGIGINNKKLNKIVNYEEDTLVNQTDLYKSLLLLSYDKKWNNLSGITEKYSKNMNNNTSKITQNMLEVKEIIAYSNILLIGLIIFGIFQIVLLFFLILKKTHRISGPAYLMSIYMEDLIKGEYPVMRPLRKGDEFKDFYSKFSKMVNAFKKREAS